MFQGPLKLEFSEAWPNGKEAYSRPATLHHAAAPRKKALVFRSNLLKKPTYFFAPPTSRAGGEPCAI